MNRVTTSAFDLPDRLAAKADPALIGRDERQFVAIAQCLEQSVAELTERIARNRTEIEAAEYRWLEVAEMAEALAAQ